MCRDTKNLKDIAAQFNNGCDNLYRSDIKENVPKYNTLIIVI